MANYPKHTALGDQARLGTQAAHNGSSIPPSLPTHTAQNGTTIDPALTTQNGAYIPNPAKAASTDPPSALSPNQPSTLSPKEVCAIAQTIAECQLPSGMIPWFLGGHADPWNHVEAAMALTVGGFFPEAQRAYEWLLAAQLPNGAWHQYYLQDSVEDDKLDTNCVAYIATGIWHYFLSTGDRDFLEKMWPVVKRAVDFVCAAQTPRGEMLWARHADGKAWPFALLTGSSSVYHSLICAEKIAKSVGRAQPRWRSSRKRLGHTIAHIPEAFAPKERWAMDWYYPVLSGAVQGQAARQRLNDGWDKFVLEGRGVRCVSDKEWITAAETAECAIACHVAGDRDSACKLFEWAQMLRDEDNCYWTGRVFPQEVHFPADEKTTYSAAAIVLAAATLGSVPSEATSLTFATP